MGPNPAPPISLVVIDDNANSLEFISTALRQPGLEILTASDPEEGLEIIYSRHPSVVITDLVMPKVSGMEVLERIIEFDPSIDVILMTAHYSTESAVEAIKKGASDYLNKPVSIATLREKISKLVMDARGRQRASELEDELVRSSRFEGMIGRSPEMLEMFAKVRRVAPHFRTILVTGETGTGKDLVARALHQLSPAARGHFVVLNCSAVVETLFESELFGHVRGAFTGATSDKMGLVEHAHGGTLFLDEIGDMPLGTQAKLLRTLQNQEVQRVGSLVARKVDLRVVAATNRDLRAAIANKEFREDLYYRLSMVELRVPRLAERKEDLPLLMRHFLDRFATQFNKPIRGLTHRAQILLSRHEWPGNVRELENVLGHACMMVMGDTIDVPDLPEYLYEELPEGRLAEAQAIPTASASVAGVGSAPSGGEFQGSLEEHEKRLIVRALEQANGNQSQAARVLRIGRDALRYKIKKYGL
ncbi:MAG: sigma-54-dependent Fis family transcriptional regulator [Acidobacteria bacterium]|nr:sigma-54-dependent Fis family transcriptional regulator [Acidobacteriota bacterium]MBI3278546.1 sigma-54-dependent Fis family transcriptional regulator [Acidobacteriota bacterium]